MRRFYALSAVLLAAVATPMTAEARLGSGVAVLDAVDIVQVQRDLVAFRDAASTVSLRLEPTEQVVWIGAQGRVGIVLTNKRVLGVTRVHGWRDSRLRPRDGQALAQLGGRVALVITDQRLLWLDAASGALRSQELGAGERLVTSAVQDDVAVAVTNRRAIGFSGGRSFSADTGIRAQERFYALRVLGTVGSVETSRRFLVFSATTASWSASPRPIR